MLQLEANQRIKPHEVVDHPFISLECLESSMDQTNSGSILENEATLSSPMSYTTVSDQKEATLDTKDSNNEYVSHSLQCLPRSANEIQ